MSISKAISLDFSDGTNTVYTKTTNVNIPFEVSFIRVANCYMAVQGSGGQAINGVITSNLVDNDVLAITREYTSVKPIKHLFDIPRPINGSYNFSINVSNTLADLSTTSRVGYQLVGTILIGTVTITLDTVLSDDIFFLSFVEDDFETPPGRLIKTGVAPYILGTNMFNIFSYDVTTQQIVVNPAQMAAGTLTGVDWFMDGNLLNINVGASNVTVNSFTDDLTLPRVTVTKKISAGIYRLNRNTTYQPLTANIIFYTPGLFKYFDLTKCEVLIDLEFYQKYPERKREIENQQYFLWSSSNLNDIKNVDIFFPVDELQIVNTDCLTDNVYDIYGFGSDLISSSTLTNENFLTFNVLQSSIYQVNKKKWIFNQPKIFSGAYKIFAKTMLTNVAFDLTAVNGDFYIHFLFIKYVSATPATR